MTHRSAMKLSPRQAPVATTGRPRGELSRHAPWPTSTSKESSRTSHPPSTDGGGIAQAVGLVTGLYAVRNPHKLSRLEQETALSR